jgi:CRP-like cAMP-binding protein
MPSGPDLNARIDLLSGVPLFAGLSKDEVGRVAAIAAEAQFSGGTVLMHEGEPGHELLVLLEGEVDVRREGRRVAAGGRGDFFGEIALVSHARRTATVTATSQVRALVIRDREFRDLLMQQPQVALTILEAFGERLPPE